MKKFTTELAALCSDVVEDEFLPTPDTPPGQGLWCEVNASWVTLELLSWYQKMFSEGEESADPAVSIGRLKDQMSLQAELLGGKPGCDDPNERLIRSWGLTKKGKAVPVSYESVLQLGFKRTAGLFNWALHEAGRPTEDEKKVSEPS